MNVPYLTQQQVAAQPAPNGYAQVDVTPFSQGAGVGQGLQSLGYDVADVAAKAKAQANQITEFNATADISERADALKQGLRSVEGPALMQAYEKLLPDYDQAVSDRLADLPPDVRVRVEQQARLTRDSLAYDAADYTGPKFQEMAVAANQRVLGGYAKSVTLAVENGAVRYSQTPSTEAPGDSPSVRAQFILDERGIEPQFAAAHATNVQYAAVNADHLTTDQETYVRIADQLWREDAHKAVIDGLLTRGDDQAAKAYFEKHKDEFAEKQIDDIQQNVNRASAIGDSQRLAGRAITTHLNDAGELSDVVTSMRADAKGDAGALEIVDQWETDQRQAIARRADDYYMALSSANAQGMAITDIMQRPEYGYLVDNDPAKAKALVTQAHDLANGTYAVTDDALYAQLTDKLNDPAQWKEAVATNYDALVGQGLSKDSAAALNVMKKQAIDGKNDFRTPLGIIKQRASELFNSGIITTEEGRDAARGNFERQMGDVVQTFKRTHKGREPTTDEMDQLIDGETTKVAFTYYTRPVYGDVSDSSFQYYAGGEAKTKTVDSLLDFVPPREQDAIIDLLVQNGLPVNPTSIAAAYYEQLRDEEENASADVVHARSRYDRGISELMHGE